MRAIIIAAVVLTLSTEGLFGMRANLDREVRLGYVTQSTVDASFRSNFLTYLGLMLAGLLVCWAIAMGRRTAFVLAMVFCAWNLLPLTTGFIEQPDLRGCTFAGFTLVFTILRLTGAFGPKLTQW